MIHELGSDRGWDEARKHIRLAFLWVFLFLITWCCVVFCVVFFSVEFVIMSDGLNNVGVIIVMLNQYKWNMLV